MAFTLEHVQQVRNGHPKQVGVLPDSVWKKLGWTSPWVTLGKSGLNHIDRKHPDVGDLDLLWLPFAIASGVIVQVDKNPRQVLVGYHAKQELYYRCALKAAQNATEVWVDSFYRIREKQLNQLCERGTVLRAHQ